MEKIFDHNFDKGRPKNWEQPEQKFDVNKPPCMYQRKNGL